MPYRQRTNSTQKSNIKTRPSSFNVLSGIRSNDAFNPQIAAHLKSDSLNNSNISHHSFQFKNDKLKTEQGSGIYAYEPENEQDSHSHHSGQNEINANVRKKIHNDKENALGK